MEAQQETDRGRIINRRRARFAVAYVVGLTGQTIHDLARHIDSDGAMCVTTDSIGRRIKQLESKSKAG